MTYRARGVLILFLLSVAAGLVSGRDIFANLSYFWGALLAMSYAWSRLSLRGVEISRNPRSTRAQVGQLFVERFELRESQQSTQALARDARRIGFARLPRHCDRDRARAARSCPARGSSSCKCRRWPRCISNPDLDPAHVVHDAWPLWPGADDPRLRGSVRFIPGRNTHPGPAACRRIAHDRPIAVLPAPQRSAARW